MYFLSKFQEYNIVINKYSHQAVHSILRTYSSHNWKCASFTQNLPIPPILCPWQPSVFSLFCYALESYSIISDSWGLPGKLRKNGANSSHSLITLYCSIFLAVLFYKVNIHWPLWKPLQTRRKVRNAHGGWAANRLGSSRPQSPLVMRAMAVTASGVTGDLSCISLCFLRTQSFRDSGLPTALRLTGPSLAQIHHISSFTETHHLLRAHLLPSREDIGHQFSFSSATWSEDGQRQEPRSHFSLFSGGHFYCL